MVNAAGAHPAFVKIAESYTHCGLELRNQSPLGESLEIIIFADFFAKDSFSKGYSL
jgi:hypothetical protein